MIRMRFDLLGLQLVLSYSYVWIRVTSHFQMQLITLVPFLTASLH